MSKNTAKAEEKLALDKKSPTWSGASTQGQLGSKNLLGKHYVLYFYPKDATPGCTLEAQDFRDAYPQFQTLGAEVIGVSRDSLKSHEKFCDKQELPFPLISDEDESVCRAFDVIRQKKLYGREYQGIDRSTFLIDSSGKLRAIWRGVKVAGHVEQVLDALKAL